MAKGPKGQKRPADVIAAAIKVAKIATGEITDSLDVADHASYGSRADGSCVERGRDRCDDG